jgi:hypothetical protein
MHHRSNRHGRVPVIGLQTLFSLPQRFHNLARVVDEQLRHWADRPVFPRS